MTPPTPARAIHAGVMLHHDAGIGAEEIVAQAVAAEADGYDSAWLSDHLIAPFTADQRPDGPFDCFTLMVAVAAATTRVRLGWAMLNTSFRNPAHLAKMLATLDHISHGRVIATLGGGFLQPEYTMYDIPFLEDPEERSQHLREVAELLRELWTRPAPETVTFEGRHVRTRELAFTPAPVQQPHPPIWIGGDSDRTIQIVKDLADGWMMGVGAAQPGRLEAARAADDWPARPLTIGKISQAAVGRDEADLESEGPAVYQALLPVFGPVLGASFEEFAAHGLVGVPAEVARRIAAERERGVNTHVFYFPDAARQARFAELVLPLL